MSKASLCETCTKAIADVFGGNLSPSRWKKSKYIYSGFDYEYGDNFKLSRNNSLQVCALCCEIYKRMSDSWFDDSKFEPLESPRPIVYSFYYSPDDIEAFFGIGGVPAAESTSSKLVRRVRFEFYRCGTLCDRPVSQQDTIQLEVDPCPSLTSRLSTHKIDHSGSPEAKELMASWSAECLRSHPLCARRNINHVLPTRVLDIGPSELSEDNLQYPRLVISNGRRARYACLSYRWGLLSQQYRTTRQNFQEHLNHISMSQLPKTFRDAIYLVRSLGLRYLWIDSLCIIQDDERDWKEECERMAGIFEHSFITISALTAESSASGFFGCSNTPDTQNLYFRTRDGALLGFRRSRDGLISDLRDSSMSSRGWILQEKILSPALAHFGKRQIHWECLTGTMSELKSTYLLPTSGPLKYFLHEVQRPGVEGYADSHFIAWYMLVQRYSTMVLTIETDRLPAILGLAQRFRRSVGVTFAAGLWVEDLHRGLLWHTRRKRPSRHSEQDITSSITSPSWSWIQLTSGDGSAYICFEWWDNIPKDTIVSMKPVERVTSKTDLELVDVWTYSHETLQKGALTGILQLWGLLTRVRVHGNHVRRSPAQMENFLRKSNSYNLHPNSDPFSGLNVRCRLDPDCLQEFDCYLLVVADWIFADTFTGYFNRKESPMVTLRCFLLLKRVKRPKKNGNSQDLGQFERIGMGAGIPSHVERLYGSSTEKRFLTII